VRPSPDAPRSRSRDLALIATFAGIIAALGVVPALYPFGAAVPITAQSMGVMLAGGILGARRGALAMLLFVALVAVGLPLLSGGRGGLGVFVGSSAGFLVGFPVAAYVVGWLSEHLGRRYTLASGVAANVIGGILVLYLFGIPGLAWFADLSITQATVAMWVFIPGDLVKAVVAALITRGVHQAYPGLLQERRRPRVASTA
jgi:biotin transport system substrate-specific component